MRKDIPDSGRRDDDVRGMAPTAHVRQMAGFGVIGLGNMGKNLALNLESHGFRVALWNHKPDKVDEFLDARAGTGQWVGSRTLEEFVRALAPPRPMLLMVPAGEPVDDVLEALVPRLSPGDVVIDGGNSLFTDTERRQAELRTHDIHFIGMGVSGGAEGARVGPSLMPGGPRAAYDIVQPVLETIAAKTESGPCVTYVGPSGAGHFVKMVHNGIEYGNMQLIAEAYDLLRKVLCLSAMELSDLFSEWNDGTMRSYLLEITALVLKARDPGTGEPLVDLILDHAGQKGTGRWTARAALELGVPIPTIAAAVDARVLSSLKTERVAASRILASSGVGAFAGDRRALIDSTKAALTAATICSYAQGMSLLRVASSDYDWHVDLGEIARIWKGGCIIRARLLDTIMHAFERAPDLSNLLLHSDIRSRIQDAERGWRSAVQAAVDFGIPIPATAASLTYFDGYRAAALPHNLTQAQRDFFGGHTYERIDRPGAEPMHTDWRRLIGNARRQSQGS
jgi:6-phosphogluconate dehydrogenase